MIIDSHQHFLFPSRTEYAWLQGEDMAPLRRDFVPADLRPLLKASGVDKTILVQTHSSLDETYEFLKIAANTDFVAGVVGWVDLTDPAIEDVLDQILASANGNYLVGLRHQVHDEPDPDWLLRPDVQYGIAMLSRRNLAYDFLTRSRELPACLETAQIHPTTRFVIDHIAKPNIAADQWKEWLDSLEPFAGLYNVWIKLSGMVTEDHWSSWSVNHIRPYVQKVVELFGPQRCLFGSDWPVCLLAAEYGAVKEALEEALGEVGESEKDHIFSNAAADVYGLAQD
jgi:L-fuconolactonase